MVSPSPARDTAPLRPIRQIRKTKTVYRFLLRTLGLPQPVSSAIVKGAKYAWNPGQIAMRRRGAGALARTDETSRLAEKGYLLFEPGRFAGMDGVMHTCQSILDASGVADEDLSARKKRFLVTVIENEDFLRYPDIFAFASSRALIDVASAYFGRVPVLSNISLWWTPPNESAEQSQLFHCDREDSAVLKFFFNVHDVTPGMGPLSLMDAQVSDRVKAALGYEKRKSSRVTDEEVSAHGGMEHQITLTGPRCAGACVDTYRCLHYGSRKNSESRLVLMIRFSDCLAPYTDEPDWHTALHSSAIVLDDVQKLALGLKA